MLERSNSHCLDYRRRSGARQAAKGQNNRSLKRRRYFPRFRTSTTPAWESTGTPWNSISARLRDKESRAHRQRRQPAEECLPPETQGRPDLSRYNSATRREAGVRRSRYPSASPARRSLEKQASLARVMSRLLCGLRFMLTAGFGRSKRVCCFSSPQGVISVDPRPER